jgi:hypothetical protein
MNPLFEDIYDLLEARTRPALAFFIRCYNRLKGVSLDQTWITVSCPECRSRSKLDLDVRVESTVKTCPICWEERDCLKLGCHSDHCYCLECLKNIDEEKLKVRELFSGDRVPKYIYQLARNQMESSGPNRYTIYEDRTHQYWVLVLLERKIEFYRLPVIGCLYFRQLLERMDSQFSYTVTPQGFVPVSLVHPYYRERLRSSSGRRTNALITSLDELERLRQDILRHQAASDIVKSD